MIPQAFYSGKVGGRSADTIYPCSYERDQPLANSDDVGTFEGRGKETLVLASLQISLPVIYRTWKTLIGVRKTFAEHYPCSPYPERVAMKIGRSKGYS